MAPKKKVVDKLPKGTILSEKSARQQWKIIEPIGEGGFGVIYSVEKDISSSNNDSSYVAKVEPHANGPLFFEKNFFMRHLQPSTISKYKQDKKIPFLGLPEFIGSGTVKVGAIEYRFLIMERFGDSIDKKLKTTGKVNYKLLGRYCGQIIDALMYIHERGYAHMDVKPENLLLKFKSKEELVYLIDFGIADRLSTAEEFTPDKKKKHNGTTLYTSRDSHQGVVTKRGDLEILGYNILQWLGVEIPWAKDVKDLDVVYRKKNEFFKNVKNVIQGDVPEGIIKYFDYVNGIKHNETPDYQYVKSLFENLDSQPGVTTKKRKQTTNVSSPPKRLTLKEEVLDPENIVPSRKKKHDSKINSATEVTKPSTTITDGSNVEERRIPVTNGVKKSAVKKRITSPPKSTFKKITSPERTLSTRKTRNSNK